MEVDHLINSPATVGSGGAGSGGGAGGDGSNDNAVSGTANTLVAEVVDLLEVIQEVVHHVTTSGAGGSGIVITRAPTCAVLHLLQVLEQIQCTFICKLS